MVVVFTSGLSRGDLEVEVGVVGEGISERDVVGGRVASACTLMSAWKSKVGGRWLMVHTGSRGSDDWRVLCFLPVINYDHLARIHSGSIGILISRRVDGIQTDPRMGQTGWIQCIVCSSSLS